MGNVRKQAVLDFWNAASCGENLYLAGQTLESYRRQSDQRYALEPYIIPFADFAGSRGKRVLEIGVGLGADHQHFAECGADLYGIDLTERAVEHTVRRFAGLGLASELGTGDAEQLGFPDEFFDVVYSWGVLHHTPDTLRAVGEVFRVLKSGGTAKVMIYHKWSLVGYMLWVRYALLALRPWRTLRYIYGRYLESPGTKAYSKAEARRMFSGFRDVRIRTVLTHGDLLESGAGQRHKGAMLSVARKLWPRWLLRRLLKGHGLFMLIEAHK